MENNNFKKEMNDSEEFKVIKIDEKADEFKCKQCDKKYSSTGSMKQHFNAKHRNKTRDENEKSTEEMVEDDNTFDPAEDPSKNSTQKESEKDTLSPDDILKLYDGDGNNLVNETNIIPVDDTLGRLMLEL